MLRRRHLDDDDDDEVIRDGERVRIPMLMRDGATTAVDYCSTDPLAAHRPGFRRAADAGVRDASERAYQQMCRDAENAWRTPERARQDAERDCVIARDEVQSMNDVEQIRSRAYEAMVEQARNAWKTIQQRPGD